MIFPALPAAADQMSSTAALKGLTLEELSQIEVTTPSKQSADAFRTPMAIFVITGEQIKRSGATSIPEALRLAPGVEVARIDGSKWAIGIRGFGDRFSRGVLVLIDGRTVYTSLVAGTYWEVQDTMMEDIDRIEVIRGPGGTIWGPNAVNGVINVITKKSADTHGLLVSAAGGNEEQGSASVRYGGGNGRGFDYRLYAKGFTRGPEQHADAANFDDWRESQGGFRLDWKRDPSNAFTVQGDIYRGEAGERVQAASYTAPYSRIIDANAELAGGNVMARWSRVFSESNSIEVQTYFEHTSRAEPNFSDARNTFDIDYVQHLRVENRNELSWGLGTRWVDEKNAQVISGLAFFPAQRTDQLFTGFFEDELAIVPDKLSIVFGTKVLHTNFTNLGLEPSVRLDWSVDSKQTVWASFTHALRTPSDAEEDFALSGYIGPAGNLQYFARFNPNKHFAPEQVNAYEIGYRRYFTPTFYIGFAGFYNHHHNLVDEEITGPPFLENNPQPQHFLLPAQFGNGLLGVTKGVEINPLWQITPFWQLRGYYSFLQMGVKDAANSTNVQSLVSINGASPRHQVAAQSLLDVTKRLTVDLDWRYVSELEGQSVPAYNTLDARLGWKFNSQWEASLVGRNLFQPSHAEYAGDPGPVVGMRRSAYLKLTWTP